MMAGLLPDGRARATSRRVEPHEPREIRSIPVTWVTVNNSEQLGAELLHGVAHVAMPSAGHNN
jgi:hypothetical protein